MIHQLRIYEIFEHNKAAFHGASASMRCASGSRTASSWQQLGIPE